ncbi:MAG TPA: DUF2339 domain-containing protein [Gaiellaceae bacterium]|nr:DUF2339 domain-containing protein [Gaiellaceae bacterium]
MTTSETATHRTEHVVNLAFVLTVHLGAGFFWLFAIGGIVGYFLGEVVGVIWGLSAAVTWVIDTVRIVRHERQPGQAWGFTFLWWLKSFIAPLFVLIEVLHAAGGAETNASTQPKPAAAPPPPPPAPAPPPPNVDLTARLDDFARRLAGLEDELRELRRLAATQAPAEPQVAVTPAVPPPPPPPPPRPPAPVAARPVQAPPPKPLAPPVPPKAPAAKQPPSGPRLWDREITFEDLFGAKALAWAGGFVTLLGIVFFFVLAVNRGWIGPAERVGLGALASLLVFGAGLWLHRAHGPVYSAFGAAGAGIAGGYATLLAATALYDLVPRPAALLLAAAVAAVATVTALAWSSELIAGLGLIGAVLAPAAIALQDGELSAVGTGFAAVMFAATACVAVARRWQPLLAVGLIASLPQVAGLVADAEVTDWGVVAVAAAFWLLYLAAGVGLQLRLERRTLASLPSTLVLVGGVLAGLSGVKLFEGTGEGWALLAVAVVEAVAAAALAVRARDRDLSAFLGVVALAVGAVAVALLLSGPALTIAWAAEAAVLAWLARRADEIRYQLMALLYLVAAAVHALFWEVPLTQLYRATADPANGIVALLAVTTGAALFAWYARRWEDAREFGGVFAIVAPLLTAFRDAQPLWRSLTGWGAGLAAVYAASLATLQVAQWIGDDVRAAFDWGHVAVTALWAVVGLAVIAAAARWSWREVRIGGLVWLTAVPAQVILFDTSLGADARTAAFVVLAAAASAFAAQGLRLGEAGCYLAALAYLPPVALYAIYETPPARLYVEGEHPTARIVTLLVFVAAAAITSYCVHLARDGGDAAVRLDDESRRALGSVAGWASLLGALYAASLGVLELGQWLAVDDDDSIRSGFEWAHVGVTGLWALTALAVLGLGHRLPSLQVRMGGLALLGAVLLEAVFFDVSLESEPRGYAFLVAAAALGLGALLDRLSAAEAPAFPFVAGFVLASIGLAVAGVIELVAGEAQNLTLLGVAAVYAAIAVAVHRDRDLSTVFWAPALVVAGWAASELLSGTWLVLVWAAAAAGLVALASFTGERRLEVASGAFLALAFVHTLGLEAPPVDLFDANRHPEDGVPALLLTVGALLAFAYYSRVERQWRLAAYGLSALLAIYAGSLAILGLAEAVGSAGVETNFQRGHSGVSAFWGTIGLVALYVGLRRGTRWLRLAGFVLFGLALAKLFLYDLAFLSSITRALSFLAVGAVLLFGGFLVQKLGAERDRAAAT